MTMFEVRGFNDHSVMAFRTQIVDRRFGKKAVAKPVELEFHTLEDHQVYDSTFKWSYEFAQAIFQALWDAGYRPADGSCGSEERTALKKHIDFAEHVGKALLDTNIHRLAGEIARSMK